MAYTNLRTAYSVGDVVYYHDAKRDSVQRAVVTRISATTEASDFSPKFQVTYTVRRKWAEASDLIGDVVLAEGELHSEVPRAFPPVPPDVEQMPDPAPKVEPTPAPVVPEFADADHPF